MTPKEALSIFEQIRLAVSGTGKDHDNARTAAAVLGELVTASQQPKAAEPTALSSDAPAPAGSG